MLETKRQVEIFLINTECIQIEVKTISVFKNFLEEEHALCTMEICVKQVFPAPYWDKEVEEDG